MTCVDNWQLGNIFKTSWWRCPPMMKQWHCYNFLLPDWRGQYSLCSDWPGLLDTVLPLVGCPSPVTVHHHRHGQCHDISVVRLCCLNVGLWLVKRWLETFPRYVTTNNQQSLLNEENENEVPRMVSKCWTSLSLPTISINHGKVNLLFFSHRQPIIAPVGKPAGTV